jgi:hypothetical protein
MMILAFQPWFKAKVLDEWSAIRMGCVGHNPWAQSLEAPVIVWEEGSRL